MPRTTGNNAVKNVTIRADFAMKVKELAELRCQNNPQVFRLLFNAPDSEILQRVRDGLDVYQHVGLAMGNSCMRMHIDTYQRLKLIASTQGYSVPQLVTMTLAASEDDLLEYCDSGINRNIAEHNQKVGDNLLT